MKEKKSGIYMIWCSCNARAYVGSSIDIDWRWRFHRRFLGRGKHHSVLLQRAWDKYGAESFVFVQLESVPRERLIEREQFWIDFLCAAHQEHGLNVNKKAGSSLGRAVSKETREKIRQKKKGRPLSPEHCAAISAGQTGRKLSPEHAAKSGLINLGKKFPPEIVKNMSAGQRRRWARVRAQEVERQPGLF